MFKKLLIAISTLAATTGVAVAAPAPYVGAGLGITNNYFNASLAGTSVSGGSYRAVPLNVFAGYGGVVNENFYLAGELFGTITTVNIDDNDLDLMKTTYTYGAAVIPGVMLSDSTLAYVRIGVLQSRFSELSDRKTGAQFGAGLQTKLTQKVDLRGEYTFVAYRSQNENIEGDRLKFRPRSDQFTLAFVYHLD